MLTWAFLAGKHIFNGQICSWHMHCLDSGQNDFSRQSREDRRELRKNIYPPKTGLFLENGSGSWLVMIVLGWEQIGWLGCSCHLMKAVLAELTCLYQAEEENDGGGRGDQFGVHRVGWFCCAAVRMFSSLVSAQGSPPHWTGLDRLWRDCSVLSGSLAFLTVDCRYRAATPTHTARYRAEKQQSWRGAIIGRYY